MRIADTYNRIANDPSAAATTQRAKVGTNDASSNPQTTPAVQAGAVKVTVSAKARELAQASNSANDVDEAKVASLRSAIQSGSFQIDSSKIADRIVDGD